VRRKGEKAQKKEESDLNRVPSAEENDVTHQDFVFKRCTERTRRGFKGFLDLASNP
jgi:hypothetical protein